MPTRPVAETILAKAKSEPAFRAALLAEALELMAENDVETAKSLIRKYVLAAIGYDALAAELGKNKTSIMRMLGPQGNPTMKNMGALLATLQKHEGVHLEVRPTV